MGDRRAEIWTKVRELKPLAQAHRAEAEELKRLPDALAAALLERDLYRLMTPEDLGGAALDPMTYFDICEELASYDGSTAWNVALAGSTAVIVGMLSPQRLREVFAGPDCAISGTVNPTGKAVRAKGGWKLSGRWSWMSGVHHARWVILGVMLHDEAGQPMLDERGAPMPRQFLLPRDDSPILDVWNVGGMRGTGSTDYALSDAFAPDDMMTRAFSGVPNTHPWPGYRLPSSFFGMGLCGVALGMARQAVDGLVRLAATKSSAATRKGICEQAQVQYAAAKADALLGSSRLYVRDSFRPIWEALTAEAPVTLEMRAKARASYVHAAESAIEAAHLCYRAAGGTGLFEHSPFEQALRDVYAVTCHATMQRILMEDAGRVMLGLPPAIGFF